MKKFITTAYLLITLIQSKSQTISPYSIPILSPGITTPISYPNNPVILTPTVCDNPDVRIFPSPNPQSEIHISINKQNPQVLLLSANTFPTFNSQQGTYWSTNGGLNWNGSDNLPNGAFGRGDPSTAFDAIGNGYVSTLNAVALNAATATGYLIQRTNNNGASWQLQVHGADVNLSDKDMIAADDIPTSPFANNLYCAWSVSPGANGTVQFNRSTNQGATFTAPITLRSGWGQGTNVQTGPNGEVYVCWADYTDGHIPEKGLGFTRSTDGGQNFSTASIVFNYTGIRVADAQGHDAPDPNIGGTRVNSFPSMAVDKSNGTHRGRIYVAYAQKENGNGKAIISLRFSDNQGATWSTPLTVSIPNGRQNWFPWIAVDDTNGDIFITYYSLDEATGFNTNTYVASSNDGGATFINQRVSDVNHVTAPIAEFGGGYAGDYIGITANSGRAFASWMDNRSGQWQIYASEVRNLDITGDDIFCTTSSPYTITNLPTGATVQWQANPGDATVNTPNSTQTTLTKLYNGSFTLSATITNACNATPVVITKQIYTGIPTVTGTYTDNNGQHPMQYRNGTNSYNNVCNNYNANTSMQVTGSSSVTWQRVSASNSALSWNQNGNDINFYFWQVNQTEVFNISSANTCGTTSYDFGFKSIDCSGGGGGGCLQFTIAPNPAQGTLHLIVPDIPAPCDVTPSNESSKAVARHTITQIKIYDNTGNLKKTQNENSVLDATVNLAGLNTGVYVVEISDGTYKERHQVIIKK